MSQLLFQPLLAAALGRAHASLFVYCSQASEDASITVDKGTNACTVIKIARAAAQKVRKVLKEKEDRSERHLGLDHTKRHDCLLSLSSFPINVIKSTQSAKLNC